MQSHHVIFLFLLALPELAHHLPVPQGGTLSFEVPKKLLEWLCDQLTSTAELMLMTEPVPSVLFSLTAGSERFAGHWLKADFEPPLLLFHCFELDWLSFSSSALASPEKTIPRFETSLVHHPLCPLPPDQEREPAS